MAIARKAGVGGLITIVHSCNSLAKQLDIQALRSVIDSTASNVTEVLVADNGKFEACLRLDVGVPFWDQYATVQGALSFSMTILMDKIQMDETQWGKLG